MWRWLVVAAATVALTAGLGTAVAWSDWLSRSVMGTPEASLPPGKVRVLASGLTTPWGLAFLPDGSALVTERDTGRILRISRRGTVREIQRIDAARPDGEGGLLGIAVSPAYPTDHWVYVYYTTEADNRIARLRLGGVPEPIFTGIPRAGQHNGGRLAFGSDGMLYASTGDTANGELAQARASLAGKILRITARGKPAPGNPFGASAVFSLGHRNVQGLAFDARGNLFASELGLERFDELNLIQPGRNYGWPLVEGEGEGDGGGGGRGGKAGDDGRYVKPLRAWPPSEASPSGIAIVGRSVYVACLRGKRLYRVDLDGKRQQQLLVGTYGRLRSVTAAPDGTLWVLTSNRDRSGQPVPEDDRVLQLGI